MKFLLMMIDELAMNGPQTVIYFNYVGPFNTMEEAITWGTEHSVRHITLTLDTTGVPPLEYPERLTASVAAAIHTDDNWMWLRGVYMNQDECDKHNQNQWEFGYHHVGVISPQTAEDVL